RLSARLRRGGRRVADATAEESFAPAAERVVDLELARCHPRSAPPPEIVVGAVSGAERLAAGDLDGDGVDEVVASGPDGATVLGGEVLSSEPLRVSGLADLDGDCLPEVFGVSASGVVALPTGTLSARGEHVVVGDAGQGLGVGAGDADGLRWGLVDGVMRGLTGSPVRGLAIGDLNGDGVDDLLAVGEAGVSAFFGGPAGPTAAVGTAPTAWTGQSVALGDFDDDGALDAAVGGDGLVRVGRNRGDGLLEGRPTLDAPGVRALRAIDADGDCADDLVVLGEGEATLWLGAEDAALREGGALPGVLDAVAADLDGDGSRELVLLGADGEVRTWVP
ncbi:MAG: hypothetical protein CMN31_20245, partial [Sandaracinus sp.]|nr:hypothetical protein [Sandaracinus sp.]